MMNRLLTIFSLFFLAFSTAALRGQTTALVTPKDTVPVRTIIAEEHNDDEEEEEEEVIDPSDSLIAFPSSGLYCNWDTSRIHYAKFDIASLKDTMKEIYLYDDASCGYVHPFSGRVTSKFGPRKRRFHYGVDIDLETGDSVNVAFDGKVRIAKKSKSYGNVIVVRHSNGLETYYAHLSKINVVPGQEVLAGDVIGLGGNTGRSRGSHLHFEIRYLGQPINPTEIISFDHQILVSNTLCLSKETFSYVEAAKKAAAKTYANSKGKKVHVVRKGDTLSGIARRYGTSTKALCKKNGIKATSTLRLGQKIRI